MIKEIIDTIYTGNCIEILPQLPEKSVDVVFADPPYNLQLSQELWRPNLTHVEAVNDAWDQFANYEAYDTFTRNWLIGCQRVLKDTGTLWVIGTYHNIFRIGKLIQDLQFWILNDVIWIKSNPMPNFRGVRFTNAHETLLWAQKEKGARYTFNHHAMKALNDDLQMRSDWYLPLCTGTERIKADGRKAHSTQKPEALLYRIIMASTNLGEIILDPFLGTGTTGAVAKKLGRHFIGIEENPDYVQMAKDRISAIVPADEEILRLSEKQKNKRISFGSLLERGLLNPGQTLFPLKGSSSATILANGHIRYENRIDSIHGMAKSIMAAPINGWEFWFYEDGTGQKQPINNLRHITLLDADNKK
jgi:site-specific DNA-methyltransferase (adenine-specific)